MTKTNKTKKEPVISIIMGSKSDFETMSFAGQVLDDFSISYETLIISAHRTPDRMFKFAKEAENRGVKIIIAGAGGAAHLPGMVASISNLPVLGVPVKSKSLKGLDSLLSIVQMPAGIPVGTLAIGEAGAKNAALLAVRILATNDKNIAKKLAEFHKKQTASIALKP